MNDSTRPYWKLIEKLDGVAAVNLAEPSPGDLERVVKAYRECRNERDQAITRADEATRAMNDAHYSLRKSGEQDRDLRAKLKETDKDLHSAETYNKDLIIKAEAADQALLTADKLLYNERTKLSQANKDLEFWKSHGEVGKRMMALESKLAICVEALETLKNKWDLSEGVGKTVSYNIVREALGKVKGDEAKTTDT